MIHLFSVTCKDKWHKHQWKKMHGQTKWTSSGHKKKKLAGVDFNFLQRFFHAQMKSVSSTSGEKQQVKFCGDLILAVHCFTYKQTPLIAQSTTNGHCMTFHHRCILHGHSWTDPDHSHFDIINRTERQRNLTKMPADKQECQISSVTGMTPHLYDIIQFIQHYHIFFTKP